MTTTRLTHGDPLLWIKKLKKNIEMAKRSYGSDMRPSNNIDSWFISIDRAFEIIDELTPKYISLLDLSDEEKKCLHIARYGKLNSGIFDIAYELSDFAMTESNAVNLMWNDHLTLDMYNELMKFLCGSCPKKLPVGSPINRFFYNNPTGDVPRDLKFVPKNRSLPPPPEGLEIDHYDLWAKHSYMDSFELEKRLVVDEDTGQGMSRISFIDLHLRNKNSSDEWLIATLHNMPYRAYVSHAIAERCFALPFDTYLRLPEKYKNRFMPMFAPPTWWKENAHRWIKYLKSDGKDDFRLFSNSTLVKLRIMISNNISIEKMNLDYDSLKFVRDTYIAVLRRALEEWIAEKIHERCSDIYAPGSLNYHRVAYDVY